MNNTIIYTIDKLSNPTGECFWTEDKKYEICHYQNLSYWEVQPFGSCDINNKTTRQDTLQLCIDFLNNKNK